MLTKNIYNLSAMRLSSPQANCTYGSRSEDASLPSRNARAASILAAPAARFPFATRAPSGNSSKKIVVFSVVFNGRLVSQR